MRSGHPKLCPKRNERVSNSVFLLLSLCYAFLGAQASNPHEQC
jgi:hypothetical protein